MRDRPAKGNPAWSRLDAALHLLQPRWTLRIIATLLDGGRRFSSIRTAIAGLSANILTERLRELERDGLVERRYVGEPADRTIYALTDLGESLRAALDALDEWGDMAFPERRQSASDGIDENAGKRREA